MLALFLEGVIPDEVYQSTDIDELVVKLRDSSDGFAEYRASWAGDYETSIHFFCDDAGTMFRGWSLLSEPILSAEIVVSSFVGKSENEPDRDSHPTKLNGYNKAEPSDARQALDRPF